MELRKCEVKGSPARFHCWEQRSDVIPPSPMVGGHSGGQISRVLGIVEFEDGTIASVYPEKIKFLAGAEVPMEGSKLQASYQQVKDELAQVKAERDAAVTDLHHNDACAICIGAGVSESDCSCECDECKLDCRCRDCTKESKWQWRGLQGRGVE